MSTARPTARMAASWARMRRRHRWLDHLARAARRYDRSNARRLAAAVTYYAFFATFALALLGFAVLGYVLDDPAVHRSVQGYLTENLPRLDAEALRAARGTAGVVGFIALPIIGLLWVDALRSSIRAVWRLEEYPGHVIVRTLIDLLVLAGLGLLLALSLAVALGTTALLDRLVDALGADATPTRWLLAVIGYVLGLGVNTLLSIAVLTGLPRLHMTPRRVLGPALLIAAGLEVIKTASRLVVERTEINPAFQVVAGAVGLLIFLMVLNQLILFAAALTATSDTGQVLDLSARRRRRRSGSPAGEPETLPAPPQPATGQPAAPAPGTSREPAPGTRGATRTLVSQPRETQSSPATGTGGTPIS